MKRSLIFLLSSLMMVSNVFADSMLPGQGSKELTAQQQQNILNYLREFSKTGSYLCLENVNLYGDETVNKLKAEKFTYTELKSKETYISNSLSQTLLSDDEQSEPITVTKKSETEYVVEYDHYLKIFAHNSDFSQVVKVTEKSGIVSHIFHLQNGSLNYFSTSYNLVDRSSSPITSKPFMRCVVNSQIKQTGPLDSLYNLIKGQRESVLKVLDLSFQINRCKANTNTCYTPIKPLYVID